MAELKHDEVTIKLPKPVKEFFEAVHRFSKVDCSFEDWCYRQIVFGVKDGLEGDSIDSLFPDLDGRLLMEAYGLDKVFGDKNEQEAN